MNDVGGEGERRQPFFCFRSNFRAITRLETLVTQATRVQTEIVEFIALPFPFPSKLKIWSFHVVVVQGQQRNVQKSVIHVQSCCFVH